MASDVTGRSMTVTRLKTCMKSRPNLKFHSFQTVVGGLVLAALEPRRSRPAAARWTLLWAHVRPSGDRYLPISAFAQIDSRTLQAMSSSSQPPPRAHALSINQAKLVHNLAIPRHAGAQVTVVATSASSRRQAGADIGDAPHGQDAVRALADESIAASFASAAIPTWLVVIIGGSNVQTPVCCGCHAVIAGLASCGWLRVPFASR